MANHNSPVVATLEDSKNAYVEKHEYRGNVQWIPFFFDNGTAGIDSGDTLTLTERLPANCRALGVQLKSAGVGTDVTATFSSAGTDISGALAIGSAIDGLFAFTSTDSDAVDVSSQSIIATIGGADFDDGANDLWGFILIVCGE